MTQELMDKMVTGSAALDPREAVAVAFRNYERYIAAPLKSVLDRDWADEDLYAVAQITANAITWRDREIAQLKTKIETLQSSLNRLSSTKSYWTGTSVPYEKPLAISASDNIPCTAALEVKLERLATYFERRSKENRRREKKHEEIAEECRKGLFLSTANAEENHGFYFSGKANSYERAAVKLREVLNVNKPPAMFGGQNYSTIAVDELPRTVSPSWTNAWTIEVPKLEMWIVETLFCNNVWDKSGVPGMDGEFTSEAAALSAINKHADGMQRRARRIDVPAKPERWITEYRSLRGKSEHSWVRSGDSDVSGEFSSEAEALTAIAKNRGSGYISIERRARRID